MIYVSLTIIPERVKNLSKTVNSLLSQKKEPDKIFINVPKKYQRYNEIIEDNQIPQFNSEKVEVVRCEDCGPGTKILGSIDKMEKDSMVILVDDDNIYEDYMIEKFLYFFKKAPNNAYSFYVHPLGNFGVGQGADGFAINTKYLEGIYDFYNKVVKNYKELFLHDDLWISYFLYFIKKNKILSLQEHLKNNNDVKSSLIYRSHIDSPGLISNYGTNLNEAVVRRDKIALKSLKYMIDKTKNLAF